MSLPGTDGPPPPQLLLSRTGRGAKDEAGRTASDAGNARAEAPYEVLRGADPARRGGRRRPGEPSGGAPRGRLHRAPAVRRAAGRAGDRPGAARPVDPGRTRPALSGVSLTVRPGEHLALVGPSGAGKSTLLALLLGLVTSESGRVAVDGTDLADLDPDDWRAQVAWVPQRPHLFAASIADNIRLGRPDASDAEVRRAARAAYADGFVEALPKAYETPLGEQGAGLSAGQRQRIALARAFRKNAPILFLDEPTAHLDPDSEAVVNRATVRLMRGRTSIVVAHRTILPPHVDRVARCEPAASSPPDRRPGKGW
ncbi:ATP-binding cassette domain-containing protein [Streptomyces sp. NPDC058818]|uniref:ATP-binding cassette domain-containing protein n=1 Tax=Streptomyces sp. NPDC058818 TaxID=3346640 RepID=UPI0036C93DF3